MFPGNVSPAEGQGGNPMGMELVYIANYTSVATENSKALVLIILTGQSFNKDIRSIQ